MKIVRKLTLPHRREDGSVEYSGFEIELTGDDIDSSKLPEAATSQDWMQALCREAQARVLACHVADGSLTNEELSRRLSGFLGPTPDWLNNLSNLKVDK